MMVTGFKFLSYEQRLDRLNLTTLEDRRKRGDLIETFRLLKGKECVDWQQFFQLVNHTHDLRGHKLKLFVPGVRTSLRKSFFSHRVLDSWNRLPPEVVAAESVTSFKSRLDKFTKDLGQ